MSLFLLQPPTQSSPQLSVELSQQALGFRQSQYSWLSAIPYPLSLFVNTESQEKWQIYENLFLASLRTGDDESALRSLQQLVKRFGKTNDRVIALHGLYLEATAKDEKDLAKAMTMYEEVLKEDPTKFSIRKRRVALLRSTGRTSDAVAALTTLLDTSPTDAEAWAELADLYLTQGAYDQAIYCLEEVLLVMPNSWNMHAKLGEVLYLSASKTDAAIDQSKVLSESMRRFCRSVELCDDYLRGYYGLKLTSSRLLELGTLLEKAQKSSVDPSTGDLALPSAPSVKKLNELATAKLAEIIRRAASHEKGWDGYSVSELAAARELLDSETQKITR